MSPRRPSIYVLRKAENLEMPKGSEMGPGDFVVFYTGDISVWDGVFWHLLPGRNLSVEETKEFISYVSSGWPGTVEEAIEDLEGVLPDWFLARMVKVCASILKESELRD
jgi:hypothetical protein